MHIIVSSGELFDYAHGEPPVQYLTALRLLKVSFLPFIRPFENDALNLVSQISEPWVTRILIDHCNVERVLMAPTRKQAENMLIEISDGVALSAEGFKLRRWKM
jgi:hypothetical protein